MKAKYVRHQPITQLMLQIWGKNNAWTFPLLPGKCAKHLTVWVYVKRGF